MKRYESTVAWYDALLARLAEVEKGSEVGRRKTSASGGIGTAASPAKARRFLGNSTHPMTLVPPLPILNLLRTPSCYLLWMMKGREAD